MKVYKVLFQILESLISTDKIVSFHGMSFLTIYNEFIYETLIICELGLFTLQKFVLA